MNRTKLVIMALLSLIISSAEGYPLILEAQRGPENPVALQNGVMRSVVSVDLPCRGKWTVSGGAAVQMNAQSKSGSFLYTAAAFSLDPNQLPVDGTADLDARPYGTWWFSASPREHTMLVDYDGATIYLVVEYYGQVPADYVQAFGSIMATIDLYE